MPRQASQRLDTDPAEIGGAQHLHHEEGLCRAQQDQRDAEDRQAAVQIKPGDEAGDVGKAGRTTGGWYRLGDQHTVWPWRHDQEGGPAGEAQDMKRSEEHTSELQSLMRISYADSCM